MLGVLPKKRERTRAPWQKRLEFLADRLRIATPEWGEAASSASAVFYGVQLFNAGLFRDYAAFYRPMARLAPQETWAGVFLAAGLTQTVFLVFGCWKQRCAVAVGMTGLWLFLVAMYQQGDPRVPIIGLFAVQALVNAVLSSYLARWHRRILRHATVTEPDHGGSA